MKKRFHPGALDDATVARLQQMLTGVMPYLPEPSWWREGGTWNLCYPWFPTEPADEIGVDEAREFLLFCLEKRLVCANVKRANFRRHQVGGLVFIDIGRWIVPMAVEIFRDAAARLYAISALEWPDARLQADRGSLRSEAGLAALHGFDAFYRDLLTRHAARQWATAVIPGIPAPLPRADDVTLLVKACAMDADHLAAQVFHLVGHLERPRGFAEKVLLLDPFPGPFLRAHRPGNFDELLARAGDCLARGLVDRVLVAPGDVEAAAVNSRWFEVECSATHSAGGVPVASQLWAFEQIRTRYVLQCDVDVLVGRRDLAHDFLGEMLSAVRSVGVLGAAFNIAKAAGAGSASYDAPPGEYVPEVRCGLLDLERIKACRPLPNRVAAGRLELSWYRSLQRHQQQHALRTLRGGDPRSFYVHPPNDRKRNEGLIARARDLTGQARVPDVQRGHWDLAGTAQDWSYAKRGESLVFLVKGRDTPAERIRRCVASLAMQDDAEFGVVVIDDASSDPGAGPLLAHFFEPLRERTTLIRHGSRQGRIPNFRLAVGEVCSDPETLVVVLDLDDALMDRSAVRRLHEARQGGCDVVLGAMFRPDKPIKLYNPGFHDPRAHWGGDVWIHLRAFRKRLFDAIPPEALKLDGGWVEQCTDYATMIPMVEMCEHPAYIPEYLYFHERSTPRTPELRAEKDSLIRRILDKPSLRRGERCEGKSGSGL